jgi:hypothetical protein
VLRRAGFRRVASRRDVTQLRSAATHRNATILPYSFQSSVFHCHLYRIWEAAAIPSARWQGHGTLMAMIQFSNLSVRPATPKARFAPILPTTEIGCNTVVRLDPPMRAFAPTPGPSEISPLTPT